MTGAREKVGELLKSPQLAVLATVTDEGHPWARYVMAVGDEELTIRVVTGMQSRKVAQIAKQPVVHLVCGATSLESTHDYFQIQARAEVTRDEAERKRMWSEMMEQYFSGPDDPNYCVLILKPYRIEHMGMDSMEPKVWEA